MGFIYAIPQFTRHVMKAALEANVRKPRQNTAFSCHECWEVLPALSGFSRHRRATEGWHLCSNPFYSSFCHYNLVGQTTSPGV